MNNAYFKSSLRPRLPAGALTFAERLNLHSGLLSSVNADCVSSHRCAPRSCRRHKAPTANGCGRATERGSTTPAGRGARRPARPEPQTPTPRRGGRRAGRRTQGARSEDASERSGACGVARAPRPNDTATGARRPRRRSAASGSLPADAPPALMGPGRTPGRVAGPPTAPGARHGRLAPPWRWRSRRAFWFETQRRLPARGGASGPQNAGAPSLPAVRAP